MDVLLYTGVADTSDAKRVVVAPAQNVSHIRKRRSLHPVEPSRFWARGVGPLCHDDVVTVTQHFVIP